MQSQHQPQPQPQRRSQRHRGRDRDRESHAAASGSQDAASAASSAVAVAAASSGAVVLPAKRSSNRIVATNGMRNEKASANRLTSRSQNRSSSSSHSRNNIGASSSSSPLSSARTERRIGWDWSEEVRCRQLSECFSFDELPFLWACATGDIVEVKRLLAHEQQLEAERQRKAKKVQQQLEQLKQQHAADLENDAATSMDGETLSPSVLARLNRLRSLESQFDRLSEVQESYVEQADSMGWCALHWAAAFDQVEVIQVLYDAFIDSLPESTRPNTKEPLCSREELGTDSYVSPIYQFLHRTTKLLDTPLHIACQNCSLKTMEWLVRYGADIVARNMDLTATVATTGQNGRHAVTMHGGSYITGSGIGPHARSHGNTPLMCIVSSKRTAEARTKQLQATRWMIARMKEREAREWRMTSDDESDEEDEQENRQLETLYKKEMNRKHTDRLPLYVSKEQTRQRSGADDDGNDAAAMIKSHTTSPSSPPKPHDTTQPTSDVNLKFNVPKRTSTSSSSIVMHGVNGMAESPSQDDEGSTHASLTFPLFPSLSSINFMRSTGATALIIAAHHGQYELVLELLKNGALVDLDLYDATGRPIADSALLNAVDQGHLSVARLLLQWGADRLIKNAHGATPLMLICASDYGAYSHGHAQALGHDTAATCAPTGEPLRLSFLHLLCNEGLDSHSRDVVRHHLLNEPDHQGHTPLAVCVRRGLAHVARWLIQNGCSLYVQPWMAWTASHCDSVATKTDKNQTIIHMLCARIERLRSEQRSRKRAKLVPLCVLLNSLLHDATIPSSFISGGVVSNDMRGIISRVLQRAKDEEAARSNTAGRRSAADTRSATTNKKRRGKVEEGREGEENKTTSPFKRFKQGSAPSTGVTSPASHTRRSQRANRSTHDHHRDLHHPSTPQGYATRRSTPGSGSGRGRNNNPTTPPSAYSSPARWFKGGKQTHPDAHSGGSNHHGNHSEDEREALTSCNNSRRRALILQSDGTHHQRSSSSHLMNLTHADNGDGSVWNGDGMESSSSESSDSDSDSGMNDVDVSSYVDDDDDDDNNNNNDNDAELPPPAPTPRIRGSIGAKIAAAEQAAASAPLHSPDPSPLSDQLHGELNHESQVDDEMLGADESDSGDDAISDAEPVHAHAHPIHAVDPTGDDGVDLASTGDAPLALTGVDSAADGDVGVASSCTDVPSSAVVARLGLNLNLPGSPVKFPPLGSEQDHARLGRAFAARGKHDAMATPMNDASLSRPSTQTQAHTHAHVALQPFPSDACLGLNHLSMLRHTSTGASSIGSSSDPAVLTALSSIAPHVQALHHDSPFSFTALSTSPAPATATAALVSTSSVSPSPFPVMLGATLPHPLHLQHSHPPLHLHQRMASDVPSSASMSAAAEATMPNGSAATSIGMPHHHHHLLSPMIGLPAGAAAAVAPMSSPPIASSSSASCSHAIDPSSIPAEWVEAWNVLRELKLDSYFSSFVHHGMEFGEWLPLCEERNREYLERIIPVLGHQLKFKEWARKKKNERDQQKNEKTVVPDGEESKDSKSMQP